MKDRFSFRIGLVLAAMAAPPLLAGDLTINASVNVATNLVVGSASVTPTAPSGSIAVAGDAEVGGTVRAAAFAGEAAALTNFPGYAAMGLGNAAMLDDEVLDLDETDDLLADGSRPLSGNLRLAGTWISDDGGDEGLRVDGEGNVGIGTNAPLAALDVAGAGRFHEGITYIKPMGGLSMGVYTNAP